ncbi:hypothetical protein [Bradyrhizobium sp. 143]|uniref:phage major capsid protein n=1 Tax=Bradyrhizobium sp. 143 TaxID=2782619 RepID=UPI001FF9A427|nr:hypothetical protein [Bradyrhizobium sp. 143]
MTEHQRRALASPADHGRLNAIILHVGADRDAKHFGDQLTVTINPVVVAEVNPFSRLVAIVEPRLTDVARWYLAADPALLPCLEFAYLAGAPGPQVETRVGFDIDGIETKVRLDYGAGIVEHRGLVTNAGG